MTGKQSVSTLASIYIGTVIGAGFASGQEILHFFAIHGKLGVLGLIISMILFAKLGSNLLQLVLNRRLNSFNDFLRIYFSHGISKWINYMMTIFLLIGYVVMLAGGGAILKELFSINSVYGILIMSFLCFVTFIFGVEGIARANNILVPVLMITIMVLSIKLLISNSYIFEQFTTDPIYKVRLIYYDYVNIVKDSGFWDRFYLTFGWLWSSILYVSFNSIVVVAVLSTLLPFIKDKKAAVQAGVIGGIGLGVMAILILSSLLIYYASVYRLEVPMIAIANNLGENTKKAYSFILWLAMFTTAIANGYGSIKNIENIAKTSQGWSILLICSLSIPLAMVGFKKLITVFYPILGYMGIIFLGLILFGRKE